MCPFEKPDCDIQVDKAYSLNPEIQDIFAKSRNYDELKYLWKSWRDNTGRKIRRDYKQYLTIIDKATDRNLAEKVDRLWNEIAPLYNDLHEYTKYKLIEIYGKHIIRRITH